MTPNPVRTEEGVSIIKPKRKERVLVRLLTLRFFYVYIFVLHFVTSVDFGFWVGKDFRARSPRRRVVFINTGQIYPKQNDVPTQTSLHYSSGLPGEETTQFVCFRM